MEKKMIPLSKLDEMLHDYTVRAFGIVGEILDSDEIPVDTVVELKVDDVNSKIINAYIELMPGIVEAIGFLFLKYSVISMLSALNGAVDSDETAIKTGTILTTLIGAYLSETCDVDENA